MSKHGEALLARFNIVEFVLCLLEYVICTI